jgi:SAM-dependent methyltransferase
VRAGDRVLDVAAGSGNAAIPAAHAGARVVASDLTPELLAAGQRQAAQQGLELEWRQADAEALPFGDDEFDVVMSCLGVMFAPHHQVIADEIVAAYRNIAADPARTAALDQELADLARRHDHGTGTTVMDWEYLLLTGRKVP